MAQDRQQQRSIVVSSSARPFFLSLLLLVSVAVVLSFASISEATATPNLGLVALYKFDGNSLDSSPKAHHGQAINATYIIWEQGRYGKALNLPYGNAFVRVAVNDATSTLSNQFTVSVWIKPEFGTHTDRAGCIVGNKAIWTAEQGFEFHYHPGTKSFIFIGSANKGVTWAVSLQEGSWYYVTLSVTGASATLWVNNQSKGARTINAVVGGSQSPLTIGKRSGTVAVAAGSNWWGTIEDFRIYNRVITADDRQLLMTNPYAPIVSPSASHKTTPSRSATHRAGATPSRSHSRSPSHRSPSRTPSKVNKSPSPSRNPLDMGLVARYKFDGNGLDSSPPGTAGQMKFAGNAAFTAAKYGQGIKLSGTGYGSVAASTTAGTLHNLHDGFSISIWVYPQYPAANTIDSRIVSKKEGWDSPSGWEFNYNQGNQFFDFLGSGNTMAGWTVNLMNNHWYHIVLLISGDQATLYANSLNKGARTIDPIVTNSIPLTLGRIGGDGWTDGTFWHGLMDDLRIYNRILTATEISDLYRKNPYPSPAVTPTRSPSVGAKATASAYPSPKPFSVPEMDVRFVDTQKLSGFDFPLGLQVAPDGRVVVWQKSGKVFWVTPSTGTTNLMVDFTIQNVGDVGDHGLLSVALHPNFASNRWIYFYYTVSPGADRNTMDTWIWSRVVRYQVASDDTLNSTTQQILIGKTAADGIPGCSSTHTVGTLKFGWDGMLYLSHGDGARFEFVDFGNDAQCGGMFGQAQNIGAFRAQSLDCMAGKILRIHPDTGNGLTDNPFYQAGMSLTSPRSRIYALGLRNPFRMEIRPPSPYDNGQSVFYLTDVGWNTWEELNVMKRGYNAGWPCWEGPEINPSYANEAPCKNMAGTLQKPLMTWHHTDASLSQPPGFNGQAGTGVAFYKGTSYPDVYKWSANGGVYCFFWCDYASNWVKAGFVDAHDNLLGYTNFFSTAAPVYMGSDSRLWDGDIHYVTAYQGAVRAISHPSVVLPVVVIEASPTLAWGLPPAKVQFSSDGTYEPYGRALKFQWSFGDGTTSTLANPVHTYTKQGNFTVTCKVTSPDGSTVATLVGNTLKARPTVTITKPTDHTIYKLNDMMQFTATRSAGTTIFWDLQLMHESHFHPQTEYSTEDSPVLQLPADTEVDTGERYSWRMVVTVTDSIGNWASDKVSMFGTHTTVNNPPSIVMAPVKYGRAMRALTFDGTASVDPDGDLLEFNWDFGDGTGPKNTFSIGITRHIYNNPGDYTVNVTVWETFGTTSTVFLPITIQETTLSGYWTMDEVGAVVGDSSGNDCPGSLVNGVTRGLGVNGGRAIQLDPTKKQYMHVTGNAELNGLANQQTVSVWVNPTLPNDNTVNSWIRILSKKMYWDATSGYELQYNPSVPAISFVGSGSKNSYAWVPLPLNTWSHIAVVANNAACSIYLNGAEITDPNEKVIDPITPNTMDLFVGKFGGDDSAFFAGSIDNVRIYSEALTAAQIKALYDNNE